MKVVIIEDETAAARNLQSIVRSVIPEAEIAALLESVEESVEWLSSNPAPDLLLVDIHLGDGESFRIFDLVDVACPIIFTTAYDQYALEAFKVNSIDYLLKPIRPEELRRALDKLERLTQSDRAQYANRISEVAASHNKSTFLIYVRDRIVPVRSDQIAFCHTSSERVTIHTCNGEEYSYDKSLETIAAALSPIDFFRANRQFIIARDAIADISVWFGSRLAVNLRFPTPERIVISKARVPEFKRWIAG